MSVATQPESENLYATCELSGIVLRVREDLNIMFRDHAGTTTVIIEDELTSRYYRIGMAEYTFLSQLDGTTNFAAALSKTASVMRELALNEQKAANFCRWLVQSGLASTAQTRSVGRLNEQADLADVRGLKGILSAVTQRVPLLHPDPAIEFLYGLLGWLFHTALLPLWLGLIGVGLFIVADQWDRFSAGIGDVISMNNWLWVLGTWLILRVVHEAAHGLACKKYGGQVREAGIVFILMVPLPYVDVSVAWRFASKWQRIFVSAAGMMAELSIAAVAAIVWSRTEPGLLNYHAYNVMWIAGVATLLFNANPLMRFDGYFMLSDLLGLPNLAGHGRQAMSAYGRRWFLGLDTSQPKYPEGSTWVFVVYGVAALIWRVLICVGLALAAETLLAGAGAILALTAIVLWGVVPLVKLLNFVIMGTPTEQPSRVRFVSAVLGLGFAAWIIGANVPWLVRQQVPAVAEFYPSSEIRCGVAGFVDQCFVSVGQSVAQGDVIAVLRNEELLQQRAELAIDIEISKQRVSSFLDQHQAAAVDVENETLVALEIRATELDRQIGLLELRAPIDGVILSESVDQLPGMFLRSGDLVATIGSSSELELIALVDQDKFLTYQRQVGQPVRVYVYGQGGGWHDGLLEEVEPRASRNIPHHALVAVAGGTVDVRARSQESDGAEIDSPQKNEAKSQQYELLQPHFIARVSVAPELAIHLARGHRATIALQGDTTVGGKLQNTLTHWYWNRAIGK